MIKTTVVGSYPIPGWLVRAGTREALRDAVLAVMKTRQAKRQLGSKYSSARESG